MKHGPWVIAFAAAAFLASLPAVVAQNVAPEPAPPAQQAAPPDKVGPALHQKQTPSAKIKLEETTGAAPKELKPSHGDAATPGKLEKDAPSR
jgi:hypothetical protein